MTLNQAVSLIRGPADTTVELVIDPKENHAVKKVSVVRRKIEIDSLSFEMQGDIAYVQINRFDYETEKLMDSAINSIAGAGAKGIILDVRNNPGGLLEQAVKVTSQFLDGGNVVQQEDAQGNRKAYPVIPGGLARDIPLVVLINEGSASSSEIFAGAIQDHKRGVIVGETTFGTGTVLQPFVLDDGSGLMLGTSQWLTAGGRLIRKQGIGPDLIIELPIDADLIYARDIEEMTVEDLLESEDLQVLEALKVLDALPQE